MIKINYSYEMIYKGSDGHKIDLRVMSIIPSANKMGTHRVGRHRHHRYFGMSAAASRKAHYISSIRKWIVDTGCGFDLVDLDDLQVARLLAAIVKAPKGLKRLTLPLISWPAL